MPLCPKNTIVRIELSTSFLLHSSESDRPRSTDSKERCVRTAVENIVNTPKEVRFAMPYETQTNQRAERAKIGRSGEKEDQLKIKKGSETGEKLSPKQREAPLSLVCSSSYLPETWWHLAVSPRETASQHSKELGIEPLLSPPIEKRESGREISLSKKRYRL